MHELKLNIADNVFKQFMELIDILPKGSIEIEELGNRTAETDPFFEKRKAMIKQRIQDLDSGKLKTESFEKFEKDMNNLENQLFINEKARLQQELKSIR